ncbi:hypothetical protein KAH94_04955 [bacterium]|nr:hypothetical protein [bacterium]
MNKKTIFKSFTIITSCFFLSTAICAAKRTITVKNSITKKMKQYKKFGTHTPSRFTIKANNELIEQEKESKITLINNKLDVRYDYAFGSRRSGAKVVTYDIPKKMNSITITFNWKTEWRILIDGAKPLSVKEISV